MRQYLVLYWRETGDEKDFFEFRVHAESIDEALAKFRDRHPLSNVDKIELVIKQDFVVNITRVVTRDTLENIFVTALEGGSNYWYFLSEDAIRLIRKAVPKKEEPYLAIAMLQAILDHNVIVPINDAENEDEVVGHISRDTMQQRLSLLANSEGVVHCLEAELSGNGDAETSDVVFQFLAMGDLIYG